MNLHYTVIQKKSLCELINFISEEIQLWKKIKYKKL